MNKLAILLLLSASFSFGQYISKATLTSKKTNNKFEIIDAKYIKDGKGLQFRTADIKNSFAYVRLKDFNLSFDSINFSKNVPERKSVFNEKEFTFPDGIYRTKEDFVSKKFESKVFEMKSSLLADQFEHNNDLVNFYDRQGKFPEFQQRDYFAIVQNGDIFFSVKEIKKRAKDHKVLLAKEIPNFAYVRVKAGSDQHLYFELPNSSQNNGYLMMFGAIGAVASVIIDQTDSKSSDSYSENYIKLLKEGIVTESTIVKKGIIFNSINQDFTFLNSCEDFNNYLKQNNAENVVDCSGDYSIDSQRTIINKL